MVVIFSRLSTGAGAEGSLSDICRVFLEAGGECDVIVGKSTLRARLELQKHLRQLSRARGHKIVVQNHSRILDFLVSKSVYFEDVASFRMSITSARFLLLPGRFRTLRLLNNARHILVGQVLTQKGVNQLRKRAPRAVLSFNHNGDPESFSAQWPKLAPFTGAAGYLQYLEAFDRFLFQNEAQRLQFAGLYRELDRPKHTIWPSCDEEDAARALGLPNPYAPGTLNLVCVAKFQEAKGQLRLIEAFRSILLDFPLARLHLVGGTISDTAYLEGCKQYVRRSSLDAYVSFWGFRSDAARFIAHADLFVLLSRGEGTSRAMRESAFLGTPIVAQSLEGSRSFLGSNGAFWVYRSGEAKVIAGALASPSKRHEVADEARKRYARLASWAKFSPAISGYFGA